ncbi:ATP-binding protein [Caldicellulosiruptor naganoensis]|uniref:ATP-binding protein n=1 Tax=Caldicellulosiruptor naganoensis TaxID=29324 RepID=A0ABY7BKE7_9FIRM|nr:ATP-binding protein [Caldicellulosiruptor naganoensis]WAM31839.1 ATP-binding protein [Caldicellulosiruptor naganoensis]
MYIEANNEYIDIYNKADLKEEELIFLFERYKSSKRGFGLGLSIVKELCKILNIKLETFVDNGFVHFRVKV